MDDARFEDADFADQPLRLGVASSDDLKVASALVQDAVGRVSDIAWMPKRRRFVILLNRFRWEDRKEAERAGRAFERVRTALIFDSVLGVQAKGLVPGDKAAIVSVLAMRFEESEAPSGTVFLTASGEGEIALSVECLDAQIVDLTRPWQATSDEPPHHDID